MEETEQTQALIDEEYEKTDKSKLSEAQLRTLKANIERRFWLQNNFSMEGWERAEEDPWHEKDSPYFGLSIAHQKRLASHRRGRGWMPAEVLRTLRPGNRKDMEKLAVHTIYTLLDVIDNGCRFDRIKTRLYLPWNWKAKFPKDFPHGTHIAIYDYHVLYQVSLERLINWLHKRKFIPFNYEELKRSLSRIMREMNKMFELESYASNQSMIEWFAGMVEESEGAPRVDRRTSKPYYTRNRQAGERKYDTSYLAEREKAQQSVDNVAKE